ncbi:MAG: hypothetical protein F4Y00_02905 [Bacteroidetes bacterium SB0662_bin_6]|nr:hypothetical protein [Bacteroidetes bacterium SB0668_bin_1]MYE03910.1 hypothetical protein [Bacteroidetes bacterium SB0662_bin_6]
MPGALVVLSLVLLPGIVGTARAQGVIDRNHVPGTERVDPFERRRDNIDANNVRATITNWAQSGQSGSPGDFWYEWPKNTGRRYVALTQLWVGAEVEDENNDTLWVVNVADFRSNPVNDNISWTFEPIKGYVNPAGAEYGIAQSDEPTSWPDAWPDKLGDVQDPGWSFSWNGFFGKNVFNADQEFFYKIGDDQYDRYPTYFPDSTDFSRRGMGLVAEVRVLAWSQILIQDVVFFIHGAKNDGTRDLRKAGMSIWLADCVGGDCSDDIPYFDLLEDVAFMTDLDGIGNEFFGADPVGVATFAFLESPGNAEDRIDNDGDGSTSEDCDPLIGECNSPVIPGSFLQGENPTNALDDNGNGLIDENQTHVPFITASGIPQTGVGYADYIDNDGDGEAGSPVVTAEMAALATTDHWRRWPPVLATDQDVTVHLVGVEEDDVGRAFKDGIDNNDTYLEEGNYLAEPGSPTVTQDMVNAAASDSYRRYRVPGTDIVLYDVGSEDIGKAYADGLDNDGDGATDEGIDEEIDEMIDESRADGIDNDKDWNRFLNDTGLDGVPFNGDPGDNDGVPTSGAGTGFPGERNIDVTDISESDQIGITNVRIFGAGTLGIGSSSDRFLFRRFMLPGNFDTELPDPGDTDITVSSGIFPLKAGQTERISLAVVMGGTQEEALQSRDYALQAYHEDYQFAQAPITPKLRAVPGDGKVTLYWDSISEQSYDQFLAGLGRDPNDFEGYRIYRSTDPAFLDPQIITDGFGNRLLRKPIAQFDLINGFEGFHPVDINGIQFYLGDNRVSPGEGSNGLAHLFVDEDVTNGITYFYAVTAYDFGSAQDNIPPTETPIRIQRLADGSIRTGPNVVEITPSAPVAGYVDPTLGELERVAGTTSSRILYEIVDPISIADGHRFRIVFEDTLVSGGRFSPDTLTTRNFSLVDVTENDTLLKRSTAFRAGREFPLLADNGDPIGFSLAFFPEPFIVLNKVETAWNSEDIYPISLDPHSSAGFVRGLRNPFDYRVKVVGPGQGQSIEMQVTRRLTLPARPTNVEVYRLLPDGTEVPIEYAFWDITGDDFVSSLSTEPASWTANPDIGESDFIVLRETKVGDDGGDPVITWRIGLNFVFRDNRDPQEGDVVTIITRKPFLATDAFEFTATGPKADLDAAREMLEAIRVVPNPYVATNQFEGLNPFSTGRGPRVIKFIHLPPQATVRIYTVSGRLIRTLQLSEGSNEGLTPTALLDGTLDWNLESEEGLSVSYGVYLYHVEAPGVGERTGTFAIIK